MSSAACGPDLGVVKGERSAADVATQQEVGSKERGGRTEEQITGRWIDGLLWLERHVDLRAGVVQTDFSRFFDKTGVKVFAPNQVENRPHQIRVGNDRPGLDDATVDLNIFYRAIFDADFLHIAFDVNIHTVFDQFTFHRADQMVGPSLKRKDTFGHEIREDDSVGNCRIFERRAIGVGDRLHQQADDIFPTGEKPVEQFASRGRLIVVEIHSAGRIEKTFDGRAVDLKLSREQASEVVTIEGCRQRKHRVVEPDVFQLDDRVGDIL